MAARFAIASTTVLLVTAAAVAREARAQDPDFPRHLREATTKAVEALALRHAKLPEAHANGLLPPGLAGPPGRGAGPLPVAGEPELRPLVALTLLRAGGPAERPLAERLLDSWWTDAETGKLSEEGSSNYQLALAISALEGTALARVDEGALTTRARYEATPLTPTNQKRLEIATRALIEGRSITGLEQTGCAWTYHMAPFRSSPGDTVERAGDHLRAFDNSNTQFAVLALHDAARAGVRASPQIAEAIANHFLECAGRLPADAHDHRFRPPRPTERETGRREPRGDPEGPMALRWGYTFCGRSPSVSMTFAGLSSLAVAKELGAKKERVEDAVKQALVGLDTLLAEVGGRVGEGYTIYSLEKALDLLEIEKVGDHDWFEPLATKVMSERGPSGLWQSGGSEDCLMTLFLARATVSGSRVLDRRSTGANAPSTHGEVFLAGKKKSVDAVALVDAYAEVQGAPAAAAHEAAGEALQALVAEGHGHDACLYGPLARLLTKGGAKHDAASSWLREVNGREPSQADAAAYGERFVQLAQARDAKSAAALRGALGEPALPLALRAFCANALGEIACADAATDVTAALERLANDEKLLGCGAGARTARAIADALVGLAKVPVPALEPKGLLAPAALLAVVEAVRSGERRAVDDSIERALAAHDAREKDPDAWKHARVELAGRGRAGLSRLIDLTAGGPKASSAFELLRAVTGELIPDDVAAWKAYLEGK